MATNEQPPGGRKLSKEESEHVLEGAAAVIRALEKYYPAQLAPEASRCSREVAEAIAEDYLGQHRDLIDGYGISKVLSYGEATRLNVYDRALEDCWIAYVQCRFSGKLQSGRVIAVSEATGEVVYAGLANDEG